MILNKNKLQKICVCFGLLVLSSCTWPNLPDVRLSRVSLTNPLGISEEKYPVTRWSFKRSLASNEKYKKMQAESLKEQEEQLQYLDPTYLPNEYEDDDIYTNLCPNNILVSRKSANSLHIRKNDSQCVGLFDFFTSIFDLDVEPAENEFASFYNFDEDFSDRVDHYNDKKIRTPKTFDGFEPTPLSESEIKALENEMAKKEKAKKKQIAAKPLAPAVETKPLEIVEPKIPAPIVKKEEQPQPVAPAPETKKAIETPASPAAETKPLEIVEPKVPAPIVKKEEQPQPVAPAPETKKAIETPASPAVETKPVATPAPEAKKEEPAKPTTTTVTTDNKPDEKPIPNLVVPSLPELPKPITSETKSLEKSSVNNKKVLVYTPSDDEED